MLDAIRTDGFVRIAYISMREKEDPAHRLVAPLGLERMNDQWRLVGQDLEKKGSPIRVFILTRILEAEAVLLKRTPRGFVRQNNADATNRLAVTFNPKLSKIQKEIIENELGIHDRKVSIAKRSAFEFARRFSNKPASTGAIWPPLDECHES